MGLSRTYAHCIATAPFKAFSYTNKRLNIVLQLDQQEPFAGVAFETATGELVEFCGPASIQDLIAHDLSALRYSVILNSKIIVPLLKVSKSRFGSDQLVGGYKKIGNGFVIFVPPLQREEHELIGNAHYFNIASISDHLKSLPDELPDWTAKYQTSKEKSANESIAELERIPVMWKRSLHVGSNWHILAD